jgi:hypothetical protein
MEGNAWPSARMRGLATKIQRQPFASFPRFFRFNDLIAGGTSSGAHAPHSNLELAI